LTPRSQSALIVEVPEAEPAVARHRIRLDGSAPLGVPAHVTVLFPLMPPAMIDPLVLAELERLFAGVSRFRFRLDHTDDLRAAETSVEAQLPIDGYATAVTLITRQAAGGRWIKTVGFTLA
jgi:hypothetical protein